MSFSGRKVPAPLPLASPWTFYSLTKLALSAGSQVSPAGELGKALWNAGQGHAFYGNSCRLLMLPLSKAFPSQVTVIVTAQPSLSPEETGCKMAHGKEA